MDKSKEIITKYSELRDIMNRYNLQHPHDIEKLANDHKVLVDDIKIRKQKHQECMRRYYERNKSVLNRKRCEYQKSKRNAFETEAPIITPAEEDAI